MDLSKVYSGYAALYQREDPPPPGRPLLIHIALLTIDKGVLSEAEVEAVVLQLKQNRARYNTHLRAKQLQGWLREAYLTREMTPPPNIVLWEKLVAPVQHMWEHSTLPTKMSCTILVLLPKSNFYTQGIELLGVLWKVVEAIIDTRIKTAMVFHDVLHVFSGFRGTGTAILDINMYQELASITSTTINLNNSKQSIYLTTNLRTKGKVIP